MSYLWSILSSFYRRSLTQRCLFSCDFCRQVLDGRQVYPDATSGFTRLECDYL